MLIANIINPLMEEPDDVLVVDEYGNQHDYVDYQYLSTGVKENIKNMSFDLYNIYEQDGRKVMEIQL